MVVVCVVMWNVLVMRLLLPVDRVAECTASGAECAVKRL